MLYSSCDHTQSSTQQSVKPIPFFQVPFLSSGAEGAGTGMLSICTIPAGGTRCPPEHCLGAVFLSVSLRASASWPRLATLPSPRGCRSPCAFGGGRRSRSEPSSTGRRRSLWRDEKPDGQKLPGASETASHIRCTEVALECFGLFVGV